MSSTFCVVDNRCSNFSIVREAFQRLIAPLYGDQEKALSLIGEGGDRLCEVLFVDELPKGLLVYKKAIEEGVLELKTLCLVNPDADSGFGYGSRLYERLMQIARIRGAERVLVTVSTSKPESLTFFQKKGFDVIKQAPDLYVKDATEIFLERPVAPSPRREAAMPALLFGQSYREDPALSVWRGKAAEARSARNSYQF